MPAGSHDRPEPPLPARTQQTRRTANLLVRARKIFRTRLRLVALGAVLTAAVATLSVVIPSHLRAKSPTPLARCYASSSPGQDFRGNFDGLVVKGLRPKHGRLVAPIETCLNAWDSGAIKGGDYTTDPARIRLIPHLQGCVLPTEIAGVFPAPVYVDVCKQLGLKSALSG